jgi:transcription initiation factor TFIIIB Brf1 subunit/transcription initiation factor TFIIB
MSHAQCRHADVMTDTAADTYVCRECGLVMRERPSLSITETHDPVTSIPKRTVLCLKRYADALSISIRDVSRAMMIVRSSRITARHPASIAACLVLVSGVSIGHAQRTLDIPHKSLSRAVSRLRRQKI